MHILRRIAVGLLSPLFVFLLFATAFDIGFVHTATNPTTIKRLAAETGVYNSLAPSLLKQEDAISTPFGDFSASDPEIQKAVSSAVSPRYVQQNVESAIDNIYQWLNGNISQPDFKINLAGDKENIANGVSEVLRQKLSDLPACSAAQNLAILRSGQFDAASATCRPYGVSPALVGTAAKTAVLKDPDLLNNAGVSAADIKSDGQSVFAQPAVKNIPKVYQQAKKTPWILSILTILTGTGIVFLSRSRLIGLRHIGINLVVVGIIMLIFSWAINRAVSTNIAPKIKVDNVVLQRDLRNLVKDIGSQIDKNYWFFGGLYTVAGIGGIIAAEALRRQISKTPVQRLDNSDAQPDSAPRG
ncbi:MAG TPA: hypothetical protein VFW90_00955 [Candidatus Saccharimonadales bacterium]|nr:hypothetical protein [Candidatus Saccharimonadales bacterium]